MLVVPVTLSTSSGMWPQAMEPEVSISSITFGFTAGESVLASGMFEMSVGAAWAGRMDEPKASRTAMATARTRRASRLAACFMVILVQSRSAQDHLGVAHGVLRSENTCRHAKK